MEETIPSLETEAMGLWRKGDARDWAEISSEGIIYVGPHQSPIASATSRACAKLLDLPPTLSAKYLSLSHEPMQATPFFRSFCEIPITFVYTCLLPITGT